MKNEVETIGEAAVEIIKSSDDLTLEVSWCPWGNIYPVKYVFLWIKLKWAMWKQVRQIRKVIVADILHYTEETFNKITVRAYLSKHKKECLAEEEKRWREITKDAILDLAEAQHMVLAEWYDKIHDAKYRDPITDLLRECSRSG